jgi:hypothetical protein
MDLQLAGLNSNMLSANLHDLNSLNASLSALAANISSFAQETEPMGRGTHDIQPSFQLRPNSLQEYSPNTGASGEYQPGSTVADIGDIAQKPLQQANCSFGRDSLGAKDMQFHARISLPDSSSMQPEVDMSTKEGNGTIEPTSSATRATDPVPIENQMTQTGQEGLNLKRPLDTGMDHLGLKRPSTEMQVFIQNDSCVCKNCPGVWCDVGFRDGIPYAKCSRENRNHHYKYCPFCEKAITLRNWAVGHKRDCWHSSKKACVMRPTMRLSQHMVDNATQVFALAAPCACRGCPGVWSDVGIRDGIAYAKCARQKNHYYKHCPYCNKNLTLRNWACTHKPDCPFSKWAEGGERESGSASLVGMVGGGGGEKDNGDGMGAGMGTLGSIMSTASALEGFSRHLQPPATREDERDESLLMSDLTSSDLTAEGHAIPVATDQAAMVSLMVRPGATQSSHLQSVRAPRGVHPHAPLHSYVTSALQANAASSSLMSSLPIHPMLMMHNLNAHQASAHEAEAIVHAAAAHMQANQEASRSSGSGSADSPGAPRAGLPIATLDV